MTTAHYLVILLAFMTACSDVTGDNGPPYIVGFPSHDMDDDAKTTNEIRIRCKGTGKAPITVAWKKFDISDRNKEVTYSQDIRFHSDGTLVLASSDARQRDDGYYQCFVKNTEGTTFSRKVRVKIRTVSEFEDQSPTVRGTQTLGSILSIDCPPSKAQGYGVIRSWGYTIANSPFPLNTHSDDGISFKHRIVTRNGNLVLSPFKQADCDFFAHEVKCKAEAGNMVFYSKPVTLSCRNTIVRKEAPKWVEELPATQEAIQGKEITMTCSASGVDVPDITWFKENRRIENGTGYITPTAFYNRYLTITKVNKADHEGIYTCRAKNRQGEIFTRESRLTVLVQPELVEPKLERNKTIAILSNASLVCRATGVPTPDFTWWKNGEKISSLPRITASGNVLKFEEAEKEDAGMYQCVAENRAGMVVTATYVIVESKAPTFKMFGPFALFLQSTGILKCENNAAPPSNKFKWYKNNRLLSISGRYSLDSKGNLTIKEVDSSDAGNYTCEATNSEGSKESEEAPVVLYAQTLIVTKPLDTTVVEKATIDFICKASWDKRLELTYKWLKDGAELKSINNPANRIFWDESRNVLQIRSVVLDDAGRYTCVAFTPGPVSEARATAVADIAGVPVPPSNLEITNCVDLKTTLSWITGPSKHSPITHFLVEQESTFEPNVFKLLKNVTEADVNSTELTLAPWATLRFRVRSVNTFGPSRGSAPTTALCRTKETKPDKYPDNLRGVPGKPNELNITWTPLTKLEQNAPGCKYFLQLRKKGSAEWIKFPDLKPTTSVHKVANAEYYTPWEFQLWAYNNKGDGPKSPVKTAYSGQDPPGFAPTNLRDIIPGPRSVKLTWDGVKLKKGKTGSIDYYRFYYYPVNAVSVRRRRRSIPENAKTSDVSKTEACSGEKCSYEVKGFEPYTNYKLAITAFNSGGEGPTSEEIAFATLQDVPSVPVDVKVASFGKYILLSWGQPAEANGIMEGYFVGVVEYKGNPLVLPLPKLSTELKADQFVHLFSGLDYTTKYVVGVAGKTGAKGLGPGAYLKTSTVRKMAPSKPAIPIVRAASATSINVTFEYGAGGGFPIEFLVKYREKVPASDNKTKEPTYKESKLYNTYKQRWVIISDLPNTLHEFRTVGKNDEGSSPQSDPVEARPLPGVEAGMRESSPLYSSAWFIVLLLIILILLLVLIILVIVTKKREARHPVVKGEKDKEPVFDNFSDEQDSGVRHRPNEVDYPPPYDNRGSLDKASLPSHRDSLDYYGEEPQFKEDGSFTEEYRDPDKKNAPPDEEYPGLATFV